MKPKWEKLASLAQEICTLWFQFFGAVFASKGYPYKNIFNHCSLDGDSFIQGSFGHHSPDGGSFIQSNNDLCFPDAGQS